MYGTSNCVYPTVHILAERCELESTATPLRAVLAMAGLGGILRVHCAHDGFNLEVVVSVPCCTHCTHLGSTMPPVCTSCHARVSERMKHHAWEIDTCMSTLWAAHSLSEWIMAPWHHGMTLTGTTNGHTIHCACPPARPSCIRVDPTIATSAQHGHRSLWWSEVRWDCHPILIVYLIMDIPPGS